MAIIGDMTPHAIACYLAVVLVGGAAVSVAPSFSAEEIAARLALAQTSLVITQVRFTVTGMSAFQAAAAAALVHARANRRGRNWSGYGLSLIHI